MAAGKVKLYQTAKLYIADGTLDLDDNTNWRLALFLSTSNADTLGGTNDVYGDLTNEHANANGYTTGGVAITPTWTQSAGTATFDAADLAPGWTASGGSIIARFGVIYKNATVNTIVKPLLGVFLLDVTPADVTTTTGNTLSITWNASGIFTLSGAAVDA
jgi:hypothetical protein